LNLKQTLKPEKKTHFSFGGFEIGSTEFNLYSPTSSDPAVAPVEVAAATISSTARRASL
jgi:hypothetical protein